MGLHFDSEARIKSAEADMAELKAREMRQDYANRSARPGAYATDDLRKGQEDEMRASGYSRTPYGQYVRRTNDGTEFYGKDGYSYIPGSGSGQTQVAPQNAAKKSSQNPWADALSAQKSVNGMDNPLYDQMYEVESRIVGAASEREKLANEGLVAALRFSADNGGRLPESACRLLSRQLGMDGVSVGILDAGYVPADTKVRDSDGSVIDLKKGSFGFTIATRGEDGKMSMKPVFLSPTDVYAVMTSMPSQFTDEQIGAKRNDLLASGYSEAELDGLSRMNLFMNGARVKAERLRKMKADEDFRKRAVMAKASSSLTFDERRQLQNERLDAQREQHKADQNAITKRNDLSRNERERREKRKSLYGELRSLTNGGRIKDKDRYGKVLEEIQRLDEDGGGASQATEDKWHNNGKPLDLSGIKPGDVTELRKRMDAAPEGAEATLDGETRVKRNGKWVKK